MAIRGFIPTEEISRLVEGCYEQLTVRVCSAINEAAPKLLGINEAVEVAGTFSGFAIVHTEDRSQAFRVKYEISETREIMPISAEPISMKTYTPDQYAVAEARLFVDAFINGSRTEAGEHLKNLLPVVQECVVREPKKITESFENIVRGERGWKKLYDERIGQIRSSIGEDVSKIEESRMREKFRKLYDGSISESELPKYADLVTSDLKYLGERVDAILTGAEKAVEAYKGAIPALKTESSDPTVKMFESFSEDYIADLRGVKKTLSEASELLNRVDEVGKIYDVLASELHRYEVAGRFVEKMTRSLSEAATEEG